MAVIRETIRNRLDDIERALDELEEIVSDDTNSTWVSQDDANRIVAASSRLILLIGRSQNR